MIEYDNCPKCGANWLGEDIFETFRKMRDEPEETNDPSIITILNKYSTYTDQQLKEVAYCYGWYDDLDDYLRFEPWREKDRANMPAKNLHRWKRFIGIYDRDLDRTVALKCPDCNEEFPI